MAAATPQLSTLLELVVAAGLADALSNPMDELTVFAPSNDAFEAVGGVDPVGVLSSDIDVLALVRPSSPLPAHAQGSRCDQ